MALRARAGLESRGERAAGSGIGVSDAHGKELTRLMVTAFRAMVVKDLRIFLNDRRAVIMSFVAPIAIASFFGFVFGGLGGKTENSKIQVLFADEDGSVISNNMLTQLRGEKTLNVNVMDATAAREAARKGSAAVAGVIPKDFGD